jgi:hypothetical protein
MSGQQLFCHSQRAKYLKVAVTKPAEEVEEEQEEEDHDPFVSLEEDVREGRYLMEETKGAKIQYSSIRPTKALIKLQE